MKNKNVDFNKKNHIFLFIIAALSITMMACGGGGGGGTSSPPDDEDTPVILEGIFEDSIVTGLAYTTATQSGVTDSQGIFQYQNGETVTFSIGGIVLGSASAKAWMTPVDLVAGATDQTHPTVTNICRFLLALDDDDDPSNGIQISAAVRNAAVGKSINFSQSEIGFENDSGVQQIIATLTSNRSAGQRGLVPINEAQNHLGVTLGNIDSNETDDDNDGYSENQGDCNDKNGNIYPGANETCGDRIDQDCNGSDLECSSDSEIIWYKDADGDGYSDGQSQTASVRPGNYYKNTELTATTGDCNDNNASVYPGAAETCDDGIDQDCNGSDLQCTSDPEITWYKDMDGDGYSDGQYQVSTVKPDGYELATTLTALMGDCDDNDASIHPGADEICGDDIDQDCSGSDLQCSSNTKITWYKDSDGDGYSDGQSQTSSDRPANYYKSSELSSTSGDCNDNDTSIHPGAKDVCGDGIDQDCNGGDLACSESTPNLTIVGSIDMETDYAKDVHVSGSYAYVANEYSGLQVIDISNPQQPVVIGSTDTSSDDLLYAKGVYVNGSYAYVVDNTSEIGFQSVDVSNPQQPVFSGRVDSPFYAHDIWINGLYAYVVDDSYYRSVTVIDISNPQQPRRTDSMFRFYSSGVHASGNYAYVADGDNGLDIVDVSDPNAIEIIGHVNTPDFAHAVFVSGYYAYIADGENGIEVVNIQNPQAPTIIANAGTVGNASNLYVHGSYVFVVEGDNGIEVVDIEDPQQPIVVDQMDLPGFVNAVYADDTYVYVAAGIGFYVVRIFNE